MGIRFYLKFNQRFRWKKPLFWLKGAAVSFFSKKIGPFFVAANETKHVFIFRVGVVEKNENEKKKFKIVLRSDRPQSEQFRERKNYFLMDNWNLKTSLGWNRAYGDDLTREVSTHAYFQSPEKNFCFWDKKVFKNCCHVSKKLIFLKTSSAMPKNS